MIDTELEKPKVAQPAAVEAPAPIKKRGRLKGSTKAAVTQHQVVLNLRLRPNDRD